MSKERLIELMSTIPCDNKKCGYECNGECVGEFDWSCQKKALAEHLLANGVIVPPCKVGDIVYEVVACYSYIIPREVVGFHLGNFPTLNGHKRKPYLVCYDKTSRLLRHIPLDKLGKTAFFKIEEAKAKLKEGENNA